ncbi:MAG: hypothetical protein IT542_13505 [Rubellimicrobium sp.]|nr:hypothetical protein [Rubellimicrobium sp.]
MTNTGRTALRRFERLEAIGHWRPAPGAEQAEVVVSLGEATVMIARASGLPLAHWSLPAVIRLNPGQMPARFGPDGDAGEVLELDDPLMIEAFEKVRHAIAAAQPRPRFLRRGAVLAVLGAVGVGLVLWLPGAARRQALALVPEATRQEIGATILGLMGRETGAACRAPGGVAALERLAARLYGPDMRPAIAVLPGDMGGMVVLPGNILVVPRAALAGTDDPLVFAGEVVATMARARAGDPLADALDSAGIRATLTLIGTGTLPARDLGPHATALLRQGGADGDGGGTDAAALVPAFAASGVPIGPWALARGQDIPARAAETGDGTTVMTDSDWISLQAICAG